ncbi:MAG: hypothetical protein J5965_23260 [Aeriscardovia sp.]|nr:hypothetical protein [Aeriscardovia sp.]
MANWDDIETINTKLETELDTFKTMMKNAVTPSTWTADDEYGDQWAAQHDYETKYDGSVLNIDKKTELDQAYDTYTGDNSYAQQQLHLMEESTPIDPDELEIKNGEIEYINTWLELMHTLYDDFLASVTIDEETLAEKYDSLRESLTDYYYDDMRSEYRSMMEAYNQWVEEDDEQEWEDDGGVVPEDFVNDFLDCLPIEK